MTPEDHNKALGIAHIAYGAIHSLLITVMMLFFLAMIAAMAQEAKDFPPLLIFGVVFGAMFVFYLALTLPSFIAGYALLKRRSWAKTASIIAAIIESMGFPFGTALCVYSLWFCFGDAGKSLYDSSYSDTVQRVSELKGSAEYVPPVKSRAQDEDATVFARMRQPPNWRD